MEDLFKSLPGSVKETLKAILPLSIVIILFFVVGNFGISKINDLRSQIASQEVVKATLTQKLSILQSFSQTTDTISAAAIAIPETNPLIIASSQLKSIAARDGVSLTNIKSGGSAATSGLSNVTTTFQVDGTRDSLLTFLNDIETIAPITQVSSARISETGGQATANVTTKTYWAPYPSVIPSVTQPITDLTSSEKQVLTQISSLIQPVFSTLTPSASGGNTAPFGQ
ncbi:MAG: hypothetical protein ABSC49_03160 [Candidatus Microgenomates bacterium]|jgi:hypothetical protein